MSKLKRCSRCWSVKDRSGFYPNDRMRDGLRCECKDCSKEKVHMDREKRVEPSVERHVEVVPRTELQKIGAAVPRRWRSLMALQLLGQDQFAHGTDSETVPCPGCGGKGYKWNGSRLVPDSCPVCHGLAYVPGAVRQWFDDEVLMRELHGIPVDLHEPRGGAA